MSEKEDLALEVLTEFFNGIEAGIQAARQLIKPHKVGYDLDKIKWTSAEGPSGVYERSEDVNNEHFKALRKDLKEHNGKFRKASFFIWVFENGTTIGRKKV